MNNRMHANQNIQCSVSSCTHHNAAQSVSQLLGDLRRGLPHGLGHLETGDRQVGGLPRRHLGAELRIGEAHVRQGRGHRRPDLLLERLHHGHVTAPCISVWPRSLRRRS